MSDVLIGNTLISEALLEAEFACELRQCKGMCCVEGESGAPLEAEEPAILEALYPAVKPFLRREGQRAIEARGTQIVDAEGNWVTPLVDGAECAYAVFEADGTAKCGIEKAYRAGAINWKKPCPVTSIPYA